MATSLDDRDWQVLLRRIRDGKCTPFVGAGANSGVLPLGSDIAKKWATGHGYPLEDSSDLARVAQFLAVTFQDPMFPKEEIRAEFDGIAPPGFDRPDDPLGVVASLPLPVYVTTNYDNFLISALKQQGKAPCREFCRWNSHPNVRQPASVFDSASGFSPSPATPIVFHLHGWLEVPESLVLTEDDYLDFLVNLSRQPGLLPARIQEAFTGASLLFIGYRLADWNFRVLFRGLINSMEASLRRLSVAVQLPPDTQETERQHVQGYLTEYFKNLDVRVYWGTAEEFMAELRERWKAL